MRTATSLVQYYNGSQDDTGAFIEAIELLDELTPTDHKSAMIKFIKTHITGKAEYAITSEVTTVAQIINKLKQKFSAKLSSDALLAQLKACKQNNKMLADFANQTEDLSRQLARAFISENVATGEAAEKLAEKFAIQSFKDNLANQETSIIVKVINLDNLSEITTKAITVDKPQTNNVLHYNAGQQRKPPANSHQNVAGNTGNYQRNRPNYRNFNNRTWHNNNRNRDNWPRPQQLNSTWRLNPNTTRNWSNQSHSRYNNRPNNMQNSRRINHCESGEYQDPQPNTETIRLGETTQINPEYTN